MSLQKQKNGGLAFVTKFTEELLRNMPKYREMMIKTKIEIKGQELKRIEKEKTDKALKEVEKTQTNYYETEREKSGIQKTSLTKKQIYPKPISFKLLPSFKKIITPAQHQEIDLGKLNVLLKNPLIYVIRCDGPNKNIIVEGKNGVSTTFLHLNEKEIMEIIKKFSETTKIPINNGILNVLFKNIKFYSVISEVVGPKFIIKKITQKNIEPPIPSYLKKRIM
ncbi:MAG: hypothetical protein QXU40_01675 [Candidatus Pacearchaeota archaeon]